jgi:type IV pilus assembly protein PilA
VTDLAFRRRPPYYYSVGIPATFPELKTRPSMQNRNPYAAPQTNVGRADPVEEYGEIKVFSPHGRLGRVRFIGYSAGFGVLFVLLVGAAVAATASNPNTALLVGGAGYVALLAIQILLAIQRSHDMNTTGWLSLIIFVPIAALLFWFVPGTKGQNDYGLQPPPNTLGTILLALILPLVALLGILAAIAIPAYQDYTIRAQVSEGLSLAAGPKAAVADAFARTGSAPADRTDAGLPADATDTAGQYVASVDVADGTILVAYGANANSTIAGGVLAIQPYLLGGEVVWRCGHAAVPAGAVALNDRALSSDEATSLRPPYLPSACRP